jgi:DNA-binding transcriptional LysR family regulator
MGAVEGHRGVALDHLLTMRSFVEVVKKGSYTEAAKSLETSRALVSRHILSLEERLGFRLLNRTTRSMTLTGSGQQYFEFCDRVLSEIREKEEELSGHNREPEGNLSIVAPKWLGNYEIAEVATSFSLEYPAIKLALSLGGLATNAYDFLERGYDIALLTRPIPASRIRAKRIATMEFVLCASPDYLARSPAIRTASDVADHRGLMNSNDPVWRLEDGRDHVKLRVQQAFASNTYIVLRRAALKGLGLAILPRRVAGEDLREGRLVQVLPQLPAETRPLYAAFAPGSATPMKVRLFITFLSNWFKAHPE